jgi:hypothetical protein
MKLDDGSRPARKRDPRAEPLLQHRETPRALREDRTPPVDWTGIQYKSPADCIAAGIDYEHIGRTSSHGRGRE